MVKHLPQQLLNLLQRKINCSVSLFNQIHALLIISGSVSSPNSTFFFNNLILASDYDDAITLFTRMLSYRILPNNYTFPPLFKSSNSVTGKSIHGQVLKRGFSLDSFINTSIVKFYSTVGNLSGASRTFDEIKLHDLASSNSMLDALFKNGDHVSGLRLFWRMTYRNVISWTTAINGLKRNKRFSDAIFIFSKMIQENEPLPNEATLVSILSVCANSNGKGSFNQGKEIHGYIIRKLIDMTVFLATALVDMYGKSGELHYARNVFDKMSHRQVCLWNALIFSLALNGKGDEVFSSFAKMRNQGFMPNKVTFVGVLTACARTQLVRLGVLWFESMVHDFGIVPRMEHYGCMVDLLGRAGLLGEAMELIKKMPFEADASIWGALLGACKVHGELEMGDAIGRRLLALQPMHCGRYIVLSNIYAEGQRWDDAIQLRSQMAETGIKKTTAFSRLHF